jgi:hypothetical protein
MKFDAQKTVAASLAANIAVIGVWAAQHFYGIVIPPEVIAAGTAVLTWILSHVQIVSIPTQAG